MKFTANFIFLNLMWSCQGRSTDTTPTTIFAIGAMEKPRFTHSVWSRVNVKVFSSTSQDSQESWVPIWSNTHFHHSPLTPVRAEWELKLILTLVFNLRYVQDESTGKVHDSSTNLAW